MQRGALIEWKCRQQCCAPTESPPPTPGKAPVPPPPCTNDGGVAIQQLRAADAAAPTPASAGGIKAHSLEVGSRRVQAPSSRLVLLDRGKGGGEEEGTGRPRALARITPWGARLQPPHRLGRHHHAQYG